MTNKQFLTHALIASGFTESEAIEMADKISYISKVPGDAELKCLPGMTIEETKADLIEDMKGIIAIVKKKIDSMQSFDA